MLLDVGGGPGYFREAFERAGQRDSAVVHYAAVSRAWQRADPEFGERRARAEQRIAALRNSPSAVAAPSRR